jgi:Leucine-rich repeat (LRR) protein
LFEILTGLHPMEKPLREMVEDALDEGGLGTVLDHKCEWDPAMAAKLAAIALRCSEQRKVKRATVQEVLPELERLRNPNYMPTLAVGNTYYHPDTGLLTTEGDSDEGDGDGDGDGVKSMLEEGSAMRAPLLTKHDDEDHSAPKLTRWRWFAILAAFAVGIGGLVFGLHLSRHSVRGPTSVGGCYGDSLSLVEKDCTAWRQIAKRSQYFARAHPPVCADPRHVTDPCSCTNVIGCEGGRIVSVVLQSRELAFDASSDDGLSHLDGLEHLDLYNNSLTGVLPPWLETLAGSITRLRLSYNQFTGPIHVVSKLIHLTTLDFGRNTAVLAPNEHDGTNEATNYFNGTLDAVAHLTSLRTLGLCCNRFSGSIDAVAKLTSLTFLDLGQNRLKGRISAVSTLTSLKQLWLYNNQIEGGIDAVTALTSLTDLGLWSNKFKGPIDAVSRLTDLSYLSLGGNRYLNGTINAVHKLTRLQQLWLYDNQFEGGIGAAGKLTSLEILNLGQNQFSGPINIIALKGLASLTHLTLNHNQFTGTIGPVEGLISLQQLDLGSNRLAGPLPSWPNKLAGSLTYIYLGNNNKIRGSIDRIASLKVLKYLHLENTQLSGSIVELAQLTSLSELYLGGCQFNGTIDMLRNLKKLVHVRLRSNKFTGSIDAVKELKSLKVLDIWRNQFTGGIAAVKDLRSLTLLDLAQNKFTGMIHAVAQLTSLEELDLDTNQFSGSITALANLTSLKTLHLNWANPQNRFSGMVPARPIDWSKVGDCDMEGNHFACPLPPTIKVHCKATCDHFVCNGSSAGLDDTDCRAWQKIVRPSKYFTTSTPRACSSAAYITDPCSCTDVIGCDGGRIVKVDLHGRGLPALDASADDSLSHFGALQILNFGPGPDAKSGNNLVGPLPQWLLKLTESLTKLSLGNNRLSGGISLVAKLVNLNYLRLAGNKLNGSVEALAPLSELATLRIDANQFSGPIDALKQLTNLRWVEINGNRLTGTMEGLQNLKKLGLLELDSNQFTGPIDALVKLTSLEFLDLSRNYLNGSIPSAISKLTGLTELQLGGNQFTGTVPQEMVQLKKLTFFALDTNRLTGKLPAFDFSQFTQCCAMFHDPFACPLPAGAEKCIGGSSSGCAAIPPTCKGQPCVGSSSALNAEDCSAWQTFTRNPMYTKWAEAKCGAEVHTDPCSCEFQDSRPNQCSDGRIVHLGLSGQGLPPQGGFPGAFLGLSALDYLGLANNLLEGSIPSYINKLGRLTCLEVNNNRFTGSIPATLAELTDLTWLGLGVNRFTGTVPQALTKLHDLRFLRLVGNINLTGVLPALNFSQFDQCCDLSGEVFTCPLPPDVNKCVGGHESWCERLEPPTCRPAWD